MFVKINKMVFVDVSLGNLYFNLLIDIQFHVHVPVFFSVLRSQVYFHTSTDVKLIRHVTGVVIISPLGALLIFQGSHI